MGLDEKLTSAPVIPLTTMTRLIKRHGFSDSIVAAESIYGEGSFKLEIPTMNPAVVVGDAELQRQLIPGGYDKKILSTRAGTRILNGLFDVPFPSFLNNKDDGQAVNAEIRLSLRRSPEDPRKLAEDIIRKIKTLYSHYRIDLYKAALVANLMSYDDNNKFNEKSINHYLAEIRYARMAGSIAEVALIGTRYQKAVTAYSGFNPNKKTGYGLTDSHNNDRSSVLPGILGEGSAIYWLLHRYGAYKGQLNNCEQSNFVSEVMRLDAAASVTVPRTKEVADRPGIRVISSPYVALRGSEFGEHTNSFNPERFVGNRERALKVVQIGFGLGHRCPADVKTTNTLSAVLEVISDLRLGVRALEDPRKKIMPPLKEPIKKDLATVVSW
jgi:hypothetical protein